MCGFSNSEVLTLSRGKGAIIALCYLPLFNTVLGFGVFFLFSLMYVRFSQTKLHSKTTSYLFYSLNTIAPGWAVLFMFF